MLCATAGQVGPPEQLQYGSYYIKETLILERLVFSLSKFLCCSIMHQKVPFLGSLSVSLSLALSLSASVLQLVAKWMLLIRHLRH